MTEKFKKALPIIVIAILLIGLPIGIYLVQRQQELRSRAGNNTDRTIDLNLAAGSQVTGGQVPLNGTFTVDVNMSPTAGKVVRYDISGVDFIVNYPTVRNPRVPNSIAGVDCAVLGTGKLSAATNGFSFVNDLSSYAVSLPPDMAVNGIDGTLHFAAFDNRSNLTRGGNYKIGAITFTAVEAGCVTISFGDTVVSAEGQTDAVAVAPTSKAPLNLVVVGPTATPTPSLTPTPTLSPTPIPTATLTPTPTTRPFPPGDYDHNYCVGPGDYDTWLSQNGRRGSNLTADGTNNGVVDIDDYQFWLDRYNNGPDKCTTGR